MDAHGWLVHALGFALVIGSSVAWKRWQLNEWIALGMFIEGVNLVVCGRC